VTAGERHATDQEIAEFASATSWLYVDVDKLPASPVDNVNEFMIHLVRMAQDWTDADFDAYRLHINRGVV
jgi:hypothetical protein